MAPFQTLALGIRVLNFSAGQALDVTEAGAESGVSPGSSRAVAIEALRAVIPF